MRLRKACCLALLLALLASPAARAGYYDETGREFAVVDNTTSLNLRDGPGYDAKVIASYKQGEWVEIQAWYGTWDLVRVVRTGRTGYMVDSYLTAPGTGGEGSGDIGVVTNQSARAFLNLREYPSYDARVLGIYYNGAQCRIISAENGWYMVEIDGMLGYFKEEFVKRASSSGAGQVSYAYAAASSGKTVNLRSAPSMSAQVLTRVPLGQQVEVLLKGTQFWYVSWQGQWGFMASAYLKESGSVQPVTPSEPQTQGYATVDYPGGLNLRQQPSASSRVLTVCPMGARAEILKPGLQWCQVRYAGTVGYMMTRYLTVYGVPGTPIRTVSNGSAFVNLRAAPNTQTGYVISQVPSGDEVTVQIPGDEWTLVSWEDQTGYMMTYFLK